jgi:hypothetical protein
MRLHVEFSDVEFPKTADERAKEFETDFRYGLDSPAKMLARQRQIPIEAAQAEIDANLQTSKPSQDPAPQQAGNLFEALISKKGK